ncbi:MAG TPA: DNA-processing protein DprA [Mobilitalea sp.]|nr:DNA-processing protein DprA [Mobilitalea sp.]
MKQKEYNYWISNLNHIGSRKIELLLQYFGSSEEVFKASRDALEELQKLSIMEDNTRISEVDIDTITQNRNAEQVIERFDKLMKSNISFITKEDEDYPSRLRQIYDAPFALYVKGKLPPEGTKALAIVGARDCSPYGKEMAKYLAGAAAQEGILIISGLARGIDAYAHEGTLAAGGMTYGILGCGIDICYPKENINLYMEMQKHGGIISEYAPGVQPFAGNFPMRNRIISGLCDGVLVIEAKEKSGSLITADMGLEQGKDIFALPGRATDRLSEGCNNLIKMGAKMVTSPKDILEDFLPGYHMSNESDKKADNSLMAGDKAVIDCLSLEPKHIEEIAILTKLPMDLLMEQLLLLELRGHVRQTMKNYYVIRN